MIPFFLPTESDKLWQRMYSVMNKIFENFYIQQFHIYILAIKENLGKSQVLYIGIALDFH